MSNKIKKIIFIAFAISVVCLILGLFLKPKANDKTAIVEKGDFVQAIYAVGTVKAEEQFNLKVGISTRLKERFVSEGDKVKKGEALLSFDDFSMYKAPFDGVVTQILFEKGELVPAQNIVLTLVNHHSYEVELTLDEKSIYFVKKNQKVILSFESHRGQKIIGEVKSIYSTGSSFIVKVKAPLKDEGLLVGMSCDVVIEVTKDQNQLLIPLGAISTQNKIEVLRENKWISIPIFIEKQNSEFAIVKRDDSRLSENEMNNKNFNIHEKDILKIVKTTNQQGMGPGGPP